jgi:PAS domain-containing protein
MTDRTVQHEVEHLRPRATALEQRQAAHNAVTHLLAESGTLGEATPRLLQAIGESTGWEVGAIWSLNRQAGVLVCVDVWRRPGVCVEEFEALTRQTAFPPHVGLPGRVWATKQLVWVDDVTADNFPRGPAAAACGLRAALAFPILYPSGAVGGVMEFFGAAIARPDDDDLRALFTSLGSQIGQFIERKRAEEELRRSRERFELAVRGSGDGLWDWDVETNEVYFSPRWKGTLGYEDHEVANTFAEWESRLHPEERELALATLRAYFEDRSAAHYEHEYRLRHKTAVTAGSWPAAWPCATPPAGRQEAAYEPQPLPGDGGTECRSDPAARRRGDGAVCEPGDRPRLRLRPRGGARAQRPRLDPAR